MDNPYILVEANIENIIDETPNIKTFAFKPKKQVGFRAGQFVEITVPGYGEAPFTPSSSPYEEKTIEVTIMKVGDVTTRLHSLNVGDKVGIRGPYGIGYPINDYYDKEILIVGGGVGLAPLRSLLFALFKDLDKFKRVVLCYGARTPADRVYKQSLKEWRNIDKVDVRTTVDVGDGTWKGKVGLVTTLLEDIDVHIENCISIVCGPPVMMKFTTFKLLDIGFKPEDIYLSMEKNMSCGFGKCGHCMLGQYYVCKDGPVFTYDKIKNIPETFD